MTNKQKGNKLKRYIKSLLRLLSKPKDMYVHAMTTCSTHFPTYVDAAAMAFPTPHVTLPRSFSVITTSSTRSSTASSDDDLKRLFTRSRSAARTRAGINRVEFDRGRKPPASAARMTRSFSTGIGRIDEDKPCEFGYDDINVVVPQIFPRSRSYAAHGRSAARRAF